MSNLSEELTRLAGLRSSGALTEVEFQQAKAQLLYGSALETPSAAGSGRTKRRPVLGCLGLIVAVLGLMLAFGPKAPPKTTAPIFAATSEEARQSVRRSPTLVRNRSHVRWPRARYKRAGRPSLFRRRR